MDKPDRKRKLVGPWRNLHGAVWLIGLAILAWRGWWWPGILVLVAISLLLQAALMQFAPDVYTDEDKSVAATNAVAAPTPAAPLPPPDHRLELLPATCPNCGGPIRGKDLKWTGPLSADCPYCGAILHMQSGQAESRPV